MAVINFPVEEPRPVIEQTVTAVLEAVKANEAKLGDRLAFTEPEAARLLSMEPHQLRDERLRGRIGASCVVKRGIRYMRSDLMAYLARERMNRGSELI